MLTVIVVAIVLVGAGLSVAVLMSGGHKKHQPVAVSSSHPPAPPPAQPSASPSISPPVKAIIPGWNAVITSKYGITYAVPPNWSVKTPDTIVGFQDPSGKIETAGEGAANYKEGYCAGHSGSWRAESVVTGYKTTDPALDALDAARKWASAGYAPTKGHPAPIVKLSSAQTINIGGPSGKEATATVTVRDRSDPCSPPRAIVHTVATPAKNGRVAVLVVLADQGVGDAALAADLQKIAGSLRIPA